MKINRVFGASNSQITRNSSFDSPAQENAQNDCERIRVSFVVHFYSLVLQSNVKVTTRSDKDSQEEERRALARGKYQTYLEMFEHSPRVSLCARLRIW